MKEKLILVVVASIVLMPFSNAFAQADKVDAPAAPAAEMPAVPAAEMPAVPAAEMPIAPIVEQPAAPAQPAAPVPAAAPQSADAQLMKVKALEEKVNDLKEKIFRSKARLMLLQETIIAGVLTGARARIMHKNDLGAGFTIESITYGLDGTPIFSKLDETGALGKEKEIELFNSSIVPGTHSISVAIVIKSTGWGIFSYMEGFKFKMKSSYTFYAEESKLININVITFEKGGLTTPIIERPSLRYDVDVKRVTPQKTSEGQAVQPAGGVE